MTIWDMTIWYHIFFTFAKHIYCHVGVWCNSQGTSWDRLKGFSCQWTVRLPRPCLTMTYCQCHGQMTPYVLNRKVLNSVYGPQTSHASQTSILHIARTFHVYPRAAAGVRCTAVRRPPGGYLAGVEQAKTSHSVLTCPVRLTRSPTGHPSPSIPQPPRGLICRENPGEPIDRWKASMHEADPIGYRRKVNWPNGTQRRL